MSSKSPEARRLDRFLSDPRYGPKLKHLTKSEQRRLTDLVTSNRSREARKALLAADEARRAQRNATDRARRRGKAEAAGLASLLRKIPEGKRDKVTRNMEHMTFRDLKFMQEATPSELRDRARSGPLTSVDGKEINLFWYK